METVTDLGQIEISSEKAVIWKIPNFYDLPQNYDTVIRSPRFNIDNRDWYMEIYPNGRRLYCSLGWFGIRALNFNCEPCAHDFCYFDVHDPKLSNMIFAKESYDNGSFCCTRLLPASLLNFLKEIFVPNGDLCLNFGIDDSTILEEDRIGLKLQIHDVQKLFQNNLENVCVEASPQAEEKKELPMETTVGELDINSKEVKWIIPNFPDLLQSYDTVARSPCFRYKDDDWYMEIYPNGRRLYSSLGWFGIGVSNLKSDSTLRDTSVCVKEKNYLINVIIKADSQNKGFYCCPKLLPTSLLKSLQDVIAPCGKLHLCFGSPEFDDEVGDENEAYGEDEAYDEDGDEYDMINIIGIAIAKETMQSWYKQKFENADAFTQTEEEIGTEKLRQDLQEISLNGNVSDIVLKVKSHEFKAHRCILAARSPVFLAMMIHDTKERNTGVVDIPDVDPTAFPDFLNYLYTGSVSNMTSENTVILYTLADKYQVNELKENCKILMMTSISIENFCDVFTLSLQHDEKELKDACIHFFAKNSLDIIETCKWQTFLSENPITGNELFIKHLKLNK